MARPKKTFKTKEPVRIRTRMLQNGNRSVYLDIYHDGSRSYEYLKMYLIPENAPGAKVQNENTMQAANAIKAKRILEITNRIAGIKSVAPSKMTLGELFDGFIEKKRNAGSTYNTIMAYSSVRYHLLEWKLAATRLKDIDKNFCADVISRIRKLKVAETTKAVYGRRFSVVLNSAVRSDLIPVNPMSKLDPTDRIRIPESTREFLTVEEVRKLIDTPCQNEILKQIFLFACFTGLRRSDLYALRWKDIKTDSNGGKSIRIIMQKTHRPVTIPLSAEALQFLPPRRGTSDDFTVFGRLINNRDYPRINKWVKSAGVNKHVFFHTARHTFATMLITLGADLYTVSKLLGHTNITQTQIYAKLVDSKKVEAVQLFNGVF